MHRTIPVLAAVLALAVAAPVLAAGGLPKLSDLQAGPYSAALHGDSHTLVTGRNVLTLEIVSVSGSPGVHLELVSASGQSLPVRLRPVTVVGGGESSGHGISDMANMPGMSGDSGSAGHATAGQAEPDPGGHAAAGHGVPAAEQHSAESAPTTVLLRGAVDLPTAGTWTANLTISAAGETHTASAVLEAVDGGPSRLYLLATGTLIGGAVVFGTVTRRLRPSRAAATTRRAQ